jgi:hypothetical protein
MRRFYVICLPLFAAFAIPAYSQNPAPPLRLIQSIPLPGVSEALDHMGIDVKRQRLFVPAETHHTVSVSKKVRITRRTTRPPRFFTVSVGGGRCGITSLSPSNCIQSKECREERSPRPA